MRDVRLGRMRFVTVYDEVKEALGGSFEAVGAGLFPSEPRPRPFDLALPLHGDVDDDDAYEAALRLRRQIRAYLENETYRQQGLYFAADFDEEVTSWLRIGGGDVEEYQQGITMGEFRLALRDVYRVGTPRSVRPARRLLKYDRRLATTPRDHLRRVYSTDFSAQTAIAQHHVPYSAVDMIGAGGQALGGGETILTDRPYGEVVSFDLDPLTPDGDVVAFDRRGFTAPATSILGDADPQAAYGWEEMYGSEQGSIGTNADPPVLQNRNCRVSWNAGTGALQLEYRNSEAAKFLEYARVLIYSGTGLPRQSAIDDARLIEYTPERAVVAIWFGGRATVCYVTLQRGWRGPHIEFYAPRVIGQTMQTARLRVVSNDADTTTLERSSGTVALGNGTDYGGLTGLENWFALKSGSVSDVATLVALLQDHVTLIGRTADTTAYGVGRPAVDLTVPAGSDGWVGARLGWHADSAVTTPAQTHGRSHLYDTRSVPELVGR